MAFHIYSVSATHTHHPSYQGGYLCCTALICNPLRSLVRDNCGYVKAFIMGCTKRKCVLGVLQQDLCACTHIHASVFSSARTVT